jgi:hypothetical protein
MMCMAMLKMSPTIEMLLLVSSSSVHTNGQKFFGMFWHLALFSVV